MRQLIALRWLAVIGQCVTVLTVHLFLGVPLPIAPMLTIIAALALLNVVSTIGVRRGVETGHGQLLAALLMDVAALTGLLYLSGGATNPFISLFLLQVVLGAVLLKSWSSWVIVAVTSACFALLVAVHRPLDLPTGFATGPFDLYIFGTLVSFALIAVLLVLFVGRINADLRARDARLADLRQQAAEEDHIVRMGLLASGAAHELGTPLASLAVIINDWSHSRDLVSQPELAEEIADMRVAVERCKDIVSGILRSAGQVRGEQPKVSRSSAFLEEVAAEWRRRNGKDMLHFENAVEPDIEIVSDNALRQVIGNILDNAREASDVPVTMHASMENGSLVIAVRDRGPGFSAEAMAQIGKPYVSTKAAQGRGLGLFLVVNVMRKLGGSVSVSNDPSGGARVALTLPLDSIAWTGRAP